jgi:hypothetical protein
LAGRMHTRSFECAPGELPVGKWWGDAAQRADEADEAFAGAVPCTEAPVHARAGPVGRRHRFAAYPRCRPAGNARGQSPDDRVQALDHSGEFLVGDLGEAPAEAVEREASGSADRDPRPLWEVSRAAFRSEGEPRAGSEVTRSRRDRCRR